MLYETAKAQDTASQELRWKVVKAMLDEFPDLRQRTKAYLKKTRQ